MSIKMAVFQHGYGVIGVGSDLDNAIDDANQWLDNDKQITIDDVEVINESMVDGGIYYAGITQALAKKVAAEGSKAVYCRLPDSTVLGTQEEEDAEWDHITGIW